MAPYEALYGRRCRTPVCWYEVGEREPTGAQLIDQTIDVIRVVRENLQAAQSPRGGSHVGSGAGECLGST